MLSQSILFDILYNLYLLLFIKYYIVLLIFIFSAISKVAGIAFVPVSVGFTIFMFFLELLVAAIQAFIFTNLTAVFIGQAIEEHHHGDDHGHH